MNIQEAKTIRLADYLQSIGYLPVKQQGNSLWYKSPFRQETEASFKVNTELNQWFDFGLGKGGNILALAKELYQDDYIPALLERIERQTPYIRPTSFSFRQQPSEPSFQQLEVRELVHPALLRYLQERGIDMTVAKNECKELLFVVERDASVTSPVIHCINYTGNGEEESFIFTLQDESREELHLSGQVKNYLYEPNSSLLKAGAFKSTATRFGLEKLHTSSHLYTSDIGVAVFPGRSFVVEEVFPFTGKLCKGISGQIPRANITVRNFPLSVEELRKRTKIMDGGDVYLFATTQADNSKILVKCRKF